MLLFTNNPAKYMSIFDKLIELGIFPTQAPVKTREIQSNDILEVLLFKSDQIKKVFHGNFLIDDTTLNLEAYQNFPGILTKFVLKSLGRKGLQALIKENSRATLSSFFAGYYDGKFLIAEGKIDGNIDCSKEAIDKKMPLNTWFVPNNKQIRKYEHRILAATEAMKKISALGPNTCNCNKSCIFCKKMLSQKTSGYKELVGDTPPDTSILWQTDSFIIMPLGKYIVGGLLVLTKEHILSMAHLRMSEYSELELLLLKISEYTKKLYNKQIIIFEHGPYSDASKNNCCESHAHLNIFPVWFDISKELSELYNIKLNKLSDISCFKDVADYILVIHPTGEIVVYLPKSDISQYIRDILARKYCFLEKEYGLDFLDIENVKTTMLDYQTLLAKEEDTVQKAYKMRDTDYLAKRWDKVAPYWDSMIYDVGMHYNKDGSYQNFVDIINDIVQKDKNMSIVDIGCGTGSLFENMPASCSKIGFDISEKMIQIAKNKKISNAEFYVQDVFKFPYQIDMTNMDLAISRGILLSHYGKTNIIAILRNIFQILRNGGFLVIDVVLQKTDEFNAKKEHYTFSELQSISQKVGFAEIEIVKQTEACRTAILILRK